MYGRTAEHLWVETHGGLSNYFFVTVYRTGKLQIPQSAHRIYKVPYVIV